MHVKDVVSLKSVMYEGYELGPIDAYVCNQLPSNIDMVLGLDVISRHSFSLEKGCEGALKLTFGRATSACNVGTPASATPAVNDSDFEANFVSGKWEIRWKWKNEIPPPNSPRDNFVQAEYRDGFDKEIESWIQDGILVSHDSNIHGEIKRFLPLIAVSQSKGEVSKIRPVCDYRELNKYIQSHTGGSTPICQDRLRLWRQMGPNCAILDLRKAYLQVRVHSSLWVYQAVKWKGRNFVLTRLGFGLTSAPKIMTAIVEYVLNTDQVISKAVSSYIDDLFVQLDFVNCDVVSRHLESWGLVSKPPEYIGSKSGIRILGLKVDESLRWSRDSPLPSVRTPLTRREVNGIIGTLLGHYPVAGWLRVVCGYLQRLTSEVAVEWDDNVNSNIEELITRVIKRVKDNDPVTGQWLVSSTSTVVVWVDSSSTAIGVVLEIDGNVVEDASWLRPKNDVAHINKSELDAVIKGVNLALKWNRRQMVVVTDSSNVYSWLRDTIRKTKNVRTRALEEVLIHRRLNTLSEIIEEMKLDVDVRLVRSSENVADSLTRIPSELKPADRPEESYSFKDVKLIHDRCHFGVERTFQLVKERFPGVSRNLIKKVVSRCEQCSRIDPALNFRYDHGNLTSNRVWECFSVDVTYVQNKPYLTVIDLASNFTIWRYLRSETASEICSHLMQIFSEFSPPDMLISDNANVFRSAPMIELMKEWDINQLHSCAYRSQGNGKVERVHRTVKRTAKRSRRSIQESVFWYNSTAGLHAKSPFEFVFGVPPRKPGIACVERRSVESNTNVPNTNYADTERNPFVVGENVYLRKPSGRCDDEWTGPHVITQILSSVSVELGDDGISRHVAHLRRVPGSFVNDVRARDGSVVAECEPERSGSEELVPTEHPCRRSNRQRRPPHWHKDYVFEIT